VTWRHVTTITPNQTYIGASATPECWAVDVAFTGITGKEYAFYFSNRGSNFGVMLASDPSLADAVDALGRPLVSEPGAGGVVTTNITGGAYDPTVLVDDDGSRYIVFGLHDSGSSYAVAQLDPTFTAFAEPLRPVVFLPRPSDGETMPSDDKSTLHKFGGVYYLSAGSMYSTATSPYGPYVFRGDANPHSAVSPDRSFGDTTQGHGRFWTWNGQWFHVWCEFVQQNNTGTPPPNQGKSYARWRDAWMTYTHYRANGELVDDWGFLDAHGAVGVGQYDAGWPRIEAEWFMAGTNVTKVQTDLGTSNVSFAVRFDLPDGRSRITFPNVKGLPQTGTFTVTVAAEGGTAALEGGTANVVAVDMATHAVLATCTVASPNSGQVGAARTVTCPFKSSASTTGVALSASVRGLTLDWWSLEGS
jgi:arabinoxylan arabinofuranohydrolase